jgi:hypothetical protein
MKEVTEKGKDRGHMGGQREVWREWKKKHNAWVPLVNVGSTTDHRLCIFRASYHNSNFTSDGLPSLKMIQQLLLMLWK